MTTNHSNMNFINPSTYQLKALCLYKMTDFSKQLSKYIPHEAAPIISQWINDTKCQFKVTRSRSTKLGDYRSPNQGKPHRISINNDLNKYAFLLTTIHEFAHLKTYQKYKHTVKPHGQEWKNNFKILMEPFLNLQIFPADIILAISQYMNNPAASSCTDINLFRTLKKYDEQISPLIHIENIPLHSIFSYSNGRQFRKGKKLRKRYECIELSSEKKYLFHPLAEVQLVK